MYTPPKQTGDGNRKVLLVYFHDCLGGCVVAQGNAGHTAQRNEASVSTGMAKRPLQRRLPPESRVQSPVKTQLFLCASLAFISILLS